MCGGSFSVHLHRNVKASALSTSDFCLSIMFLCFCLSSVFFLTVFVLFVLFQNEEKRNLSLGGHVGFDSLPDQLVSKSVTQGFCFNILCVGMYKKTTCVQCVCVRDNVLNVVFNQQLTKMICHNY